MTPQVMTDFLELVTQMREAQRGFFASTPNTWERKKFFHQARSLEAEVDQKLKDFNDPQIDLFATGE